MAVSGHAVVAGHLVVEDHPRADVGALPDVRDERVEERDRLDEVGRERVQQQSALGERLAHEAELELLEVAQPAVDQLARAARGAGGEVARLHERDRQAAGGGVKGRVDADDAAADHDDLEHLRRQPLEGGVTLLGVEDARVDHWRLGSSEGSPGSGPGPVVSRYPRSIKRSPTRWGASAMARLHKLARASFDRRSRLGQERWPRG
jgi:hypothetical protein